MRQSRKQQKNQQMLLFNPAPCPIVPQWGGHYGMGPRLSRLLRVLHLVAQQPQALEQPKWWLTYGTERMGLSSLYWARAMKLIELLEDGSYRLSSRGQMLLAADPYLEGVGNGSGSSDLLWILHWWTVSDPCLSHGISWLLSHSAEGGWESKENLLAQMESTVAETGEAVGRTVLQAEVKMLLDAYLLNPREGWEATVDRPFLELRLLQSREEDEPHQQMKGRRIEPVRPKQAGLSSLVIAYATLSHAVGLDGGNQPAGKVKLSTLLYKSWSAPAIQLRFTEYELEEAVDQLKQQGLLRSLELDYSLDEGGTVMAWTGLLADMQQGIWQHIAKCA